MDATQAKIITLQQWAYVCKRVRMGAKKRGVDLSKIKIVREEKDCGTGENI